MCLIDYISDPADWWIWSSLKQLMFTIFANPFNTDVHSALHHLQILSGNDSLKEKFQDAIIEDFYRLPPPCFDATAPTSSYPCSVHVWKHPLVQTDVFHHESE